MSLSGRRTYSFSEISPFYEPGLAKPNPLSAPSLFQTPIITANGSSKRFTQRDMRISSPRTSPYPSPPRTKTVTTTPRSRVTFRSPARSPIPDKSEPRLRGTRTSNQHHRSSSSKQQPEPQPPEENLPDGKSDLIQKPDGEAGRPGRGGYNLEKVLNWKKQDFKAVKVFLLLRNILLLAE
jgi:hypothetical protein